MARVVLPAPQSTTTFGTKLSTKIGTFVKGTFIQSAPRYIEFGTSNPASNMAEGPYLRIYPASQIDNGVGAWAQPGTQNISWDKAGAQVFVDIAVSDGVNGQNDGSGFYYELDANQGAIYLPFDCSVELCTYRPGMYVYDVISYQDAQFPANFVREYRQTRTFKGNATRTIWVPYGAYEWQMSSVVQIAANQPQWGLEDSPGALAVSADTCVAGYGQFRRAIPNARKVDVTPGPSTGAAYQPCMTFFIKF